MVQGLKAATAQVDRPISCEIISSADQRRRLRALRRSLGSEQILARSNLACTHLLRHVWFGRARHIAVYCAMKDEADPALLIQAGQRRGKKFYLPVVVAGNRLQFVAVQNSSRYRRNLFHIHEPLHRPQQRLHPRQLDLVILPLTGFDASGRRIGTGGGFYDRSFSFRRMQRGSTPRLLGLALEVQRCRKLRDQYWDVRLDAVITETGVQMARCSF